MFFRKKKNQINALYLGNGFPLGQLNMGKKESCPVIIPDDIRNAHWMTFGGSRTGKSRLLIHAIQSGIESGRDIIVIDPKFERELLPAMLESARKIKREHQLFIVDAVHQESSSIQINPFSGCRNPDEIAELIMAAIPTTGEQFFREFARKTINVAIGLAQYDQNDKNITYTVDKLTNIFSFNFLKEKYEFYSKNDAEDSYLKTLISITKSLVALGADKFEKYASNLSNALSVLSLGVIRGVINSDKNELLDRISNGSGVICYIYTGGLIASDAANMLGRLILSMLQRTIGHTYRDSPTGKLARTLEIHCDEASNLFYPGIENLFNKAGGCGVWLHFLTQSLADIDNVIGKDRRAVILDSCASKVFLCCGDAEITGRYVTALAGEPIQLDISGQTGLHQNSGFRLGNKRQAILDCSSVTQLKARQFFAFIRNHGNFVGTVLNIEPPEVGINTNLTANKKNIHYDAINTRTDYTPTNPLQPYYFDEDDHALLAYLRWCVSQKKLEAPQLAQMVPHRRDCPRWGELLLKGEISAGMSEKSCISSALGYSLNEIYKIGIEILRNDPQVREYDFFLHSFKSNIEAKGPTAVDNCAKYLGVTPDYVWKRINDRGVITSISFQMSAANFLGCSWHDMILKGKLMASRQPSIMESVVQYPHKLIHRVQ